MASVLALAVLLGLSLPAAALEPAQGKVILTISGQVAEKNTPTAAVFDLAMLQKLPQHSFTTMTPWDKQPIKFTGPLLRDVLAAVKSDDDWMPALLTVGDGLLVASLTARS